MDLVLRAVFVFGFMLLLTRVIGKRELGSLEPFDLILLIVLGDALQQGLTQDDYSLTGAVLVVGTIAVLQVGVSYLTFRFPRPRPVLDGEPLIVIEDGKPIERNLERERLTLEELAEAARREQIAHLADVQWAILETSGQISFIPKKYLQELGERARVEHVGGASPRRAAPCAPRARMSCRAPRASARRSSRRSARRPRAPRRTCSPRRSSRSGRPFTSSATPVSSATSIVALQVERVLGPVADQAPGRMAEAARRRVAHRVGHARASAPRRGARWPAWSEICTQSSSASTSSGRSSVPSRQDVALGAAQHAERRERARSRRRSPRPGGGASSASRPGTTRTFARVVADREVLVAARPAQPRAISSTVALPSDQVVWQCRSPRISRDLDERRRLAAAAAARAARAAGTAGRAAR